jgi:altronate dehydratase large subunit
MLKERGAAAIKEITDMKFLGYVRPDGQVGIRNHMLVVASGRGAGNLATLVGNTIAGAKIYVGPNENGRDSEDRATIARIITGLAENANTGAVLVVGNKRDGGYPEFSYENIVGQIATSGKSVDTLFLSESGGFYASLGEGMRKGRALAEAASECRREEVDFGKLSIAVKCGYSDATSGMSGNPVVGKLFDRLVADGGTAMFAETTEVIGAEHLVAERFTDATEREKFLKAVQRVEEEAKATGEDIRNINPIPANIQAGLTTLEEKSLGAVAKAGSSPLQQCLKYGERPKKNGLHYMDAWMSSTALFLGFAAAGATLTIFQMGGGWMPDNAMMPTARTGLVVPTLYSTGNPRMFAKSPYEIDFNAGTVITEKESLDTAGERLARYVCRVASGTLTKGETLNIQENMEVYLRGPGL